MNHPPFEPVDGIRHGLGSTHPDAVLFSNHVMETFGGVEAARRDFGGYLMEFSKFLDLHLEQSRRIRFRDRHPDEARRTISIAARKAAWDAPEVDALVRDVSLTQDEVGRILGVSGSTVRGYRRRLGIAHPRHVPRRVFTEEEMAVLRDPTLTAPQAGEKMGLQPSYVRKLRSKMSIKMRKPKA